MPRLLYRLVGIATVILSVTLPALTAAQFANKDFIISCMSVVIAAFTGLGSFYHWDRTWQKNATAQASIEAYPAKWELELARAKEFVAAADLTIRLRRCAFPRLFLRQGYPRPPRLSRFPN
jgi:hypothetical protein